MATKVEKVYEQLSKTINDAAKKKDLASFEEYMGQKMCIDAHLIGKNTLAGFRSLFTFTGTLFIVMNTSERYLETRADFFDNIDIF